MPDKKLIQEAHRGFSASAHNQAVDLLYEDNPSTEQIESLIELAHVAHWHWQKRDDKTPQNISVAQWLLSRAYSANGLGILALDYATASLATIENEDLPISYYGYSNEALARAHLLLGDKDKAEAFLAVAKNIASRIPTPEAKEHLSDQLNRIVL